MKAALSQAGIPVRRKLERTRSRDLSHSAVINHLSAPRKKTDETSQDLQFACVSFVILLCAALADLVFKIHI